MRSSPQPSSPKASTSTLGGGRSSAWWTWRNQGWTLLSRSAAPNTRRVPARFGLIIRTIPSRLMAGSGRCAVVDLGFLTKLWGPRLKFKLHVDDDDRTSVAVSNLPRITVDWDTSQADDF